MSPILISSKLHPLIYVVADKPTKDNVSKDTPLVGTKTYKVFLEWLGYMDVDISRVRLYNQIDKPFSNIMSKHTLKQSIDVGQIRVLALGQKAGTYLKKEGITFFLLPHPSGRNRLLNDKKFVKVKLIACRKYIYKGELNEQQSKKTDLSLEDSGYLSDC